MLISALLCAISLVKSEVAMRCAAPVQSVAVTFCHAKLAMSCQRYAYKYWKRALTIAV
jgi:hypothetical protein